MKKEDIDKVTPKTFQMLTVALNRTIFNSRLFKRIIYQLNRNNRVISLAKNHCILSQNAFCQERVEGAIVFSYNQFLEPQSLKTNIGQKVQSSKSSVSLKATVKCTCLLFLVLQKIRDLATQV